MSHRVSAAAEADLDDVWLYVARQNVNIAVANQLIDSITNRFFLLAKSPHMGRARDDLYRGLRSFAVGEYVILYCLDGEDVLILRVVHGRRDIEALFDR